MSLSVIRPEPITYANEHGNDFGLRLMSDLHIGAANVDYDLIKAELEDARKNGDRILINGDVFDGILPSDRKRYKIDAIHPRLRHHTSPLNGAIEWATEILSPYADLIDMMAVGNHESSLEKYNGVDPVSILIYKLGGKIPHGSIGGFVRYSFRPPTDGGHRTFTIFYHHGAGGNSPVTKGMIDFQRLSTWVDGADLVWIGHKHNRIYDGTNTKVGISNNGKLYYRPVNSVMTGGYMTTYTEQSQASILKDGRHTNYAAERGMAPQQKGGVRVDIHVSSKGLFSTVQM